MAVLQECQQLLLASRNAGKIKELQELIAPYGVDVLSAIQANIPDVEETGATFEENALIKAKAAASISGLPALADDSGLCVSALNGEPGIYSARWAGPQKDFDAAMAKVAELLQDQSDRSAYFQCTLALCFPDGTHQFFTGQVHGHLVFPARGTLGFGYDPIFIPDGYQQTFAEMNQAEKQRISHRAQAFDQFVENCLKGKDGDGERIHRTS